MARTMATITERRAAAELRRRQAGEAGDRGGDVAYRQYRSQAPGVGRARLVSTPSILNTERVTRNGKTMVHTMGFFTRYERPYPMWDTFGEYEEVTARGSGTKTLASSPDVAFLVNHKGVTMARTRNDTLVLTEQSDGGFHDAWLNPERQDVRDFVSAVDDRLVTEMSYAFMIPEGKGEWSEDFLTFWIHEWDIDRGDVSGTNYGANLYTDITAQTPDVLDALDRLPAGALREAAGRLAARGQGGQPRERIEVRAGLPEVDPKASRAVRALQGRHARTAVRYLDLAVRNGLSVADLVGTKLPWYEIRASGGSTEGTVPVEGDPVEPESTDVFIYDEIGGSMGVSAKKFAADLNAITTPTIRIRFHTPGGSVFDGEAIHSTIMQHPSHTIGIADGLVASAGSLIFMACNERVVMPAGELMMHDASMTTEGNAAAHGQGQTFLDRHSDHLADIYAERMGVTREEARQMMLDETWAFADEAVAMGLADRAGTRAEMLAADDPHAERMRRSHDLTRFAYRYQGRSAAPTPDVARERPLSLRLGRRFSGPSFETEGTDRAAAIQAEIDGRKADALERSSVRVPTGRSIASIEARLASLERE